MQVISTTRKKKVLIRISTIWKNLNIYNAEGKKCYRKCKIVSFFKGHLGMESGPDPYNRTMIQSPITTNYGHETSIIMFS